MTMASRQTTFEICMLHRFRCVSPHNHAHGACRFQRSFSLLDAEETHVVGTTLLAPVHYYSYNFHPPWLLAHRRKRTCGQFSVAMKERLQVCSTSATAPSSPTESDSDFCFSFSEHIRSQRSLLLVTFSHLPNGKKQAYL